MKNLRHIIVSHSFVSFPLAPHFGQFFLVQNLEFSRIVCPSNGTWILIEQRKQPMWNIWGFAILLTSFVIFSLFFSFWFRCIVFFICWLVFGGFFGDSLSRLRLLLRFIVFVISTGIFITGARLWLEFFFRI